MKTAIIIPARYGSTRFPGKPLALIAGKSMLQRVYELAQEASKDIPNVTILIATEDQRIADHAGAIGAPFVMTSEDCATGSDRALDAIKNAALNVDFILNLQGDAPFTPIEAINAMLEKAQTTPDIEALTPVRRLTWAQLDRLRENKKTTPFSGTTATVDASGKALWFSKNIIPGIRKETTLREQSDMSPVLQHMGLYGFTPATLEKFCALPQSTYENLEGLEQLRMLENGISLQTVEVTLTKSPAMSGIDTPEDLARAEEIFKQLDAAEQEG